ncbi:ATP-binding cassette domain-containing protein [Yoonia sp.]|uniref:ATP-binding cassette domain-containing protein n=1 Tax=Yoonia sp. TaxID=2212373 RepID=UPI002FD87D85
MFPLVVQGAEARRKGARLIGPVDLTLGGQGVTVVIGPNGAGKTTLLGLLHGIVRLAEGQITWQVPTEAARRAQSFVFQRPVMLRRSVLDNLAYPLRIRGLRRASAQETAVAWAARIGLAGAEDRPATSLSGGEQQKLALARALITAPELVFLDEPTASLDGRSTREIESLLQEQRAAGTRIIMSTHHMGQARRLADDVIFLCGGKIVETGPATDFFETPQSALARAFLNGDILE